LTFQVENPNVGGPNLPQKFMHLVYAGPRGEHPLELCAMDEDAQRASQWIFAVSETSFTEAPAGTYALQSTRQATTNAVWKQLEQSLAVGSVWLQAPAVITGTGYTWPYPVAQGGNVRVLVAPAVPVGTPLPDRVFFVRSAVRTSQWAALLAAPATLRVGDQVLLLDDASDAPLDVRLYPANTSRTIPSLTLVVIDQSTTDRRAWWHPATGAPVVYTQVVSTSHAAGQGEGAARTAVVDGVEPATQHAFILLTRRSDGLFPATLAAVGSNLTDARWSWTYPLSLGDGSDRFAAEAFTDGLLGEPVNQSPGGVDYAGIRRRLGPRLLLDARPPEYLRVNMDMGNATILRAFVWALVSGGSFPTLTLHGSNAAEFYVDQSVDISQRVSAGLFSRNSHTLAHNATLLWQLTFDRAGSAWTASDVANNNVDVYFTYLSADPRYIRIGLDGAPRGTYTGFDASAHVFPTAPTNFPAFRYYALTVSVGLYTGTTPLTVEIQEFQPLVEAPPPATTLNAWLWPAIAVTAPPSDRCEHGRGPMPAGSGLYTVTLSRAMPAGTTASELGYLEVWDSFKTRSAYHQGQSWSVSAFPQQMGLSAGMRRATASLLEVLVPRAALLRSINMAITDIPFVWCYVRHRALQCVGEQAAVVTRLVDPDRVLEASLQPPPWTTQRDTLWFHLPVPSARLPGEARYVGLSASNTVQVWTTDTIPSALPEFCFTLPSGEVLDFEQYDGNLVLPAEAPQDEWAAVSALFVVQYEDPPTAKRQRLAGDQG
jgi:hypothetical protein